MCLIYGTTTLLFFFLTVSTRRLESANEFKLSRKKKKNKTKQKKNLCQGQVSLHNWGALWAKRGERNILHEARNECEAKNEGRRKIKRLLPVHCSGSSAHLRPQVVSTAIAGKSFPYDRYDRCDAIVANLKLVNQAFSWPSWKPSKKIFPIKQ